MKKETEELIDWIKKQINIVGECTTNASLPYWKEDREKAFKFLDSLPNIEHRLCFGGYIQDDNGTPCKDGDYVIVTVNPKYKKSNLNKGCCYRGILIWSNAKRKFYISTNYKDFDLSDFEQYSFTKEI